MLDLAFRPDKARKEPVYRQLAEYLEALIQAGRLAPGVKLPATRELSAALRVSRNTVNQAYQGLLAEGLLTAHVGQGTFVAGPPEPARAPRAAAAGPGRGFVWSSLFSQRTRSLIVPRGGWPRDVRFNFQGGQVAADALPAREFRKALNVVADYRLDRFAEPPDPFGWQPLRQEIAAYLVSRGIACEANQVLIVNGGQHAIDLTARVLLDPGDTVVMEQPGYFGAVLAFSGFQANLVGVGVDGEGMRTDQLARVLRARRVKLVYTTPAAQSPTGVVMSDARREALLALADEYQTPVFEDDYDSELRYGQAPVAALKTVDPAGQVIYAGTFSKVLFPGLRVGYVVAAQALLMQMVLARFATDMGTSGLMQAALAEFLQTGAFERHLRRLRKLYAERLAATLHALEAAMPEGVAWTRPGGGHNVWVTLPATVDPDALFHAARAAGIAYTRGELFHFDGGGRHNIAFSFANHSPDELREGVTLLGGLVRDQMRGRAGRAGRVA